MIRILSVFGLLVVLLIMPLTVAKAQTAAEVLPSQNVFPGWSASYDALYYVGDDLFFLINGGADLYMEYGFADVAAVEMKHPQAGTVYIEVYRMDSDSAAFGIFSLRKGNHQVKINPGQWVVYGHDFLHLWQGNFYISVSANRLNDNDRKQAFDNLIAYLAKKIPANNNLPGLLQQYTTEEIKTATYIMGPLALSNIYNFGHENIFGVKQAIAFDKENHTKLIIAYPNEHSARETFDSVSKFMETSGRFGQFSGAVDAFSVSDRQNKLISARVKGSKIMLEIK